jgi:hypothetical protein
LSSNFITICNIDISNLFIIGNKNLVYSYNSGINFNSINFNHNGFTNINMFDIYNGYIIGISGLILRTNNGVNWSKLDSGTINTLNSISIVNSNEVIIVGNNGTVLRTFNRGIVWSLLMSGTNEKFNDVYSIITNNITIVGNNNLIQSYLQSPNGSLKIYDNETILYDTYVEENTRQITYNFQNFGVKKYWLNALFVPLSNGAYSNATTPIKVMSIKPIYYYNTYLTDIVYERPIIYSNLPFIDQSGGIFSIIDVIGTLVQQNLVYINEFGQIVFNEYIPVNRYNFIVIYSLNTVSTQQTYQLIVRPNLLYASNSYENRFGNVFNIEQPYYNPYNGLFTLSDSIGNLVRSNKIQINSISGIITVSPYIELGNYSFGVIYNYNQITNTNLINLSVLTNLYYEPNIVNLEYQSGNKSVIPIYEPSGGIFSLEDISSYNIVSKSFINSKGQITFNSNIDVGFYYVRVKYLINNKTQNYVYSINSMPYFKYYQEPREIEWIRPNDISSTPLVIPSGGVFTFNDNSGNLINLNLVQTNNNGQIIYGSDISVGNYSFNLRYEYNGGYKFLIHQLIVKPYIRYYEPFLIIPYDTSGNSLIPICLPSNGIFSITEVDNILIQLNMCRITNNGQIFISKGPDIGIYNFTIGYTFNNILSNYNFQVRIVPTINYSINQNTINYDMSGISIIANVKPSIGIYTISSLISNKVKINQSNGRLLFDSNIPVGNYNINVSYGLNNLFSSTNYFLNVIPNIYYKNNNLIINYNRELTKSIIPYVNPSSGIFNINIFSISNSGEIIFLDKYNVGNYNLLVSYIFNNNINYTNFYVTIQPNINISSNYIEKIYDSSNILYSPLPIVDQSGGLFSVIDISGQLKPYINSNTGILTISTNISVEMYKENIIYTLNNTTVKIFYDIVVKPNIYYAINNLYTLYKESNNTDFPYTNPNNGNFFINSNSNQIQIFNNGKVYFGPNIYIGIYNYIVTYIVNNITNTTNISLYVAPLFNYNINNLTIDYDTSGISIVPYVNPLNGIFDISDNNINLTNNGILLFNKGINVGTNNYIIYYFINNVYNSTNYTLYVRPIVKYIPDYIIVDYERGYKEYSINPIYQQLNGLFTINDYVGTLIQNNYVRINIETGIIEIDDLIDVNSYTFIITYTLNNLSNTTFYSLVVRPIIDYNISTLVVNYQNSGNSIIPLAKQENGLFNIYDISGKLVFNNNVYIDNSGIIYSNNDIDVGLYILNVTYTLRNLTANTNFLIKIIPNIRYNQNTKILNYGQSGTSFIAIVSPSKGIFSITFDIKLFNKVTINTSNGIITFNNNIDVGKYIINVIYTYNGISNSYNYYLIVNPLLIYNIGITTILFNHQLTYSEQPYYMQTGGVFELENNINDKIYIDNSGIIIFDRFINVGQYNLNIKYSLNDVFTRITYILIIKPNFDLTYNYKELLYPNYFELSDTVYSYVDQSGGTFSYIDISGDIIKNNLLELVDGTIYLGQTINVDIYEFMIIYTYNGISNTNKFIINIKPEFYYTNNYYKTIFNSSKYSIQPYVNQPFGSFSIVNNINGLFIDSSNGIINFSYDLDIGDYIIELIYRLRRTYNITYFYLSVLPIVDYGYPYFISEYNTTTTTTEAIYDPAGGNFTIIGNSDPSGNIIINNLITNNQIIINSMNGTITFLNTIPVGYYPLVVFYNYGNTSNSVNVYYTMKPYLLYVENSKRVPYHDISYSQMPIYAPNDGIFTASVPRINLIYTGISINKKNGILTFGYINAGFWIITIKYTVNGVSNTATYNLQILANVYYNPPYSVISYNTVYTTTVPIAKVSGGIYSLGDIITGVNINTITGALTFSYLTTGIYYIPVIYTVFGSSININYTLLVKPTITYPIDYISALYTYTTTSVLPLYNPLGGKFSATFNDVNNSALLSTIQIDSSSGIITSTSDLRVGRYELNVSYLSNESEEIVLYTIEIFPIFTYLNGLTITTYGFDNFSEKPFTNPRRGVFKTSNSDFYVDGSSGIIEIKKTNNVGKYILPISYTYNNIISTQNYNIIINPYLNYEINKINQIYGYYSESVYPIALQQLGLFYINNISGTFNIPIQTVYNNLNIINNFGVVLNGYNGLLKFGKNIKVGTYKFNIKYAINDLSSNQTYSLTVYPDIYYSISGLLLDYNTNGSSIRPFVDTSGGYFTIGNITQYKNEASKININNLNGILNFYKGISVGSYYLNIKYEVNKIINTTNYNLIIRPNYYYLNDTMYIIYGSVGYSEIPFVLTSGGKFYIEDYGSIDSSILSVDISSGIVRVDLLNINIYTIKLRYTLAGSSTFTNLNIVIKPYIDYPIGIKNITYGSVDYSEKPIGLEPNGVFSFEDITELDFQQSKVIIDTSNGIIYFGDYINVSSYNLIIKYTYNNISNTYNYILNIKPQITYDISNLSINHYRNSIININEPIINPTKGLFYFNDISNSFFRNNIQLNKNTGDIILYDRIPTNYYNLFINYYIKNVFNQYLIKLNVYPNFDYGNNNKKIIYYDISSILINSPYIDPSGGIFELIQPIDINLYSNVKLNNNGSINIIPNINIGSWFLGIKYINKTDIDINLNIEIRPTVNYFPNYLNILLGNNGESKIPFVNPFGGVFSLDISNNLININSNIGVITVGLLDVGIYNFNVLYTYNQITTIIPFTIYILFLARYDVSGSLINYGFSSQSNLPYVDINDGLFSIPNSYKNMGINIDSSNGILYFSSNINVNTYIIPVTYSIYNLYKTNNYLLIVQPYISYDISDIQILYKSTYKSNKPYVNPINGSFTSNYIIDSSGIFTINNLDVNRYNLNINYTYNNLTNRLVIPIISKPIFYYNTNRVSTIYNQIIYSDMPTISPFFGNFSIDNNNFSINNNGIIKYNELLDIGKYLINAYYTVNNITNTFQLYVIQSPYIKYNENTNNIIVGIDYYTNPPIYLPIGGLFNSSNLIIDTSGILYYSSLLDIQTINTRINYSFGDISNNYILEKNIIPYLSYPLETFNYGQINYSSIPDKRTDYGKFYIRFEPQTYIQTEQITIDPSNGIIKLGELLDAGQNYFYVNYYKNKLNTEFTYNFIIKPYISYPIIEVNQLELTTLKPILRPSPLNTSQIILNTQYDFIELISDKTGELLIKNTNVGYYNINVTYIYKDISSNYTVNLEIKPEFYYDEIYNIVIGYTAETNIPYTSESGGIFSVDTSLFPDGLSFDTETGIFYFDTTIPVGVYEIEVEYILNNISVTTIFGFNILPYISYSNFATIEYGSTGETIQPDIYPEGGKFHLITLLDGLTIDEDLGIIYTSTNIKVNSYKLSVGYTYNNVIGIGEVFIYIIPKTLFIQFEAYDKIYDGTSTVQLKSNKLTGILNNDKVFIKPIYNANFISPEVGFFIPIFVENLELDGPDSYNYQVEQTNNTFGNILYVSYRPNTIRVNRGIKGNSKAPNISNLYESPSFLIKNPIDGITISPYGIISWDDNVPIGIYNLQILVYNLNSSFEITYKLEVTTNLYIDGDFGIQPPNLIDNVFETSPYQLRYNTPKGKAFVIETDLEAVVAKIEITAYNAENNINHDLLTFTPFIFELPNTDISDTLLINELNDDGTINPKYVYELTWIENKKWLVNLRYLSDFIIQNQNVIKNTPPIFNYPSGIYYSLIEITIRALPFSTIYYTTNGTTPTYDSEIYRNPLILTNTTTIKAFAVTPGYLDSNIVTITYTVVYIPCILTNTLVKTPDGYEFIDNLNIGDLVVTSNNDIVPIKSILKYKIEKPKERELPIIIPKNFFANNIPDRDTYITENHAILYKNKWLLGNHNLNIFKKLNVIPLYYNIELPNYFKDHLVINNMSIESWCARKHKYRYINKTQEIINNKKLIVVSKVKI